MLYKGVIRKGTKRAAELGFPTVNIPFIAPEVSGVYAARVKVDDESFIAAAFADQKKKVLEAHLLNFPARELYGKEITIELFEKIRDGMEFKDDAKLRAAIADDVEKVRIYFKS